MVFEKKSGKPVSRSFHKFFNLGGPIEECSTKYIDLKQSHVFLEKKDGTMTCALLLTENDKPVIKFRTKMGTDTEVAKKIQDFIDKSKEKDNYLELLMKWLSNGYTPIFEYVAPHNRIVLGI